MTVIIRSYTTDHDVWRVGGWVYKQQPAHMTENEYWCLKAMYFTGYVPDCERVSKDTIRMIDLGVSQPVTDVKQFLAHLPLMLTALKDAGIRHGDLTEYAIIVIDNKPYIIDFAESRLLNDPRPDERVEGDAYWLTQTMHKLCG